MRKANPNLALVPDDATVYRAYEIADKLAERGASLRSVAEEIGSSASTLMRFMRESGYESTRSYYVRRSAGVS